MNYTEIQQSPAPFNSNFKQANTIPMTLVDLKEKHIIPVYAKDNEIAISHFEFMAFSYKALFELFPDKNIDFPEVKVSHPIHGRIPEAREKKPSELLEHEKTLYYERLIFLTKIPGFTATINGEPMDLVFGGVKSFTNDNLHGKHSRQHFKIFLGYQVHVCSNMCVSSDMGVMSLEVFSVDEIQNAVKELFGAFEHEIALKSLRKLNDVTLSQQEFEQYIGKVRLHYYNPVFSQKDWLGDQQMGQVTKGYFTNPNFAANHDGSISLWNVYNLMTEANKSSYIDRFIPKAMQISNMLSLA